MCLRFVFLLITRLAAWLRLSRREEAWQTAEILILRHQLAVLQRQQPRRPNLDWADRALIAALAGRGVRPDSLDRLRLSDRRPLAQSALVLLGAVALLGFTVVDRFAAAAAGQEDPPHESRRPRILQATGPGPVTAGRLTPGYLHSGPARTPRRRLQRDRTFPRRPLRSRRMLFCPQQEADSS
jgi:hypothetical protein